MELFHRAHGHCGQIKCYGTQYALEAEISETRAGVASVSFQFAEKLDQGREYNWEDKLTIQLTPRDLPRYAAGVIQGRSVEFRHYGDQRNKSLEIRSQEGGALFVGKSPQLARAVPVTPSDLYWLRVQILSVLRHSSPRVSTSTTLQLLAMMQGT
jgi:hypothetical protein